MIDSKTMRARLIAELVAAIPALVDRVLVDAEAPAPLDFLTVPEYAEQHGVCQETIRRLLREGIADGSPEALGRVEAGRGDEAEGGPLGERPGALLPEEARRPLELQGVGVDQLRGGPEAGPHPPAPDQAGRHGVGQQARKSVPLYRRCARRIDSPDRRGSSAEHRMIARGG